MENFPFVFAKTQSENRRRNYSSLANCESENFYFAFASGTRPSLLLRFLRPTRNLPLRPSNLLLASRHYFSLFISPFFSTSVVNKSIKKSKTSKKKRFT
jgi:hypothetical protein